MERKGRNDKNIEFREFIESLRKDGYNQSDIARHCGVSRQRVSKILKEMENENEK